MIYHRIAYVSLAQATVLVDACYDDFILKLLYLQFNKVLWVALYIKSTSIDCLFLLRNQNSLSARL
jgi:hypothetical protein